MLTSISTKLFRGIVESHEAYFDPLSDSLKKGKIPMPAIDYVCVILFLSLISFSMSFIAWNILGLLLIRELVFNLAYAFTAGLIISSAVAAAIGLGGYYYPSMKASTIKKEINRSLPFSAFYMATAASSGINPVEIFRILSLKKGVVGSEAKKIYNNVRTLGQNLSVALSKAASNSPSPDLADLLWGVSTVMTSGGDLEAYLKGKTQGLMNKYRRSLTDYAKSISLYTEIYITLIIVGTVLFIVLTAIMSPLAGFEVLFIQTFLVFFFIPLVSIAFIVILKTISPSE